MIIIEEIRDYYPILPEYVPLPEYIPPVIPMYTPLPEYFSFPISPNYCGCGKEITNTGGNIPIQKIVKIMNGIEEVIYYMCSHGVVLVDKRKENGINDS